MQFYILIPWLTLAYVESILITKSILKSKSSKRIYFTDDGFSVGLSYLIRVLRITGPFNSLNWFESV